MIDGKSTPLVSVVVPVLNGEPTVGDCLASLLRMDFSPNDREILVVYTPSRDRTLEIIGRYPVRILVEERLGVGYARNTGIEASRGQFVAFTDADCLASTGWLAELMEGFSDESAAAVQGEVVPYPPRTPVERYAARRKPMQTRWVRARRDGWFLSGCVAVRRSVFNQIGLFDTAFPWGAEDMEFGWRLLMADLPILHRPKAVVFHRNRMTCRALWRQHAGYAEGQVLLRRKYPNEVSWGWRREGAAWLDLGASVWTAARGWARSRSTGDEMAFYQPYYDFVRKLAQRTGFVRGSLRPTTRRGAGVEPVPQPLRRQHELREES